MKSNLTSAFVFRNLYKVNTELQSLYGYRETRGKVSISKAANILKVHTGQQSFLTCILFIVQIHIFQVNLSHKTYAISKVHPIVVIRLAPQLQSDQHICVDSN